MPTTCCVCGKEVRNPQARFCSGCGHSLTPAGPPQGGAPEGPRLIIRIPGQPPQEVILDRPAFTIGRQPDNNIVLPPDYVSGYHGRLERLGECWRYTDLGSTNGTFVNGQRVQEAFLRDGDILRIGDIHGNSVSLTFRITSTAEAPLSSPTTIRVGERVLGMKPSLLIGRDPQADIHLPAPTVSRQHARIDRTPQGHRITDLNSTNGTFVNGRRLTAPYLLRQGDVVQIGPFKLVYEATGFQQYTATDGVRLDGIGLNREVGRGAKRKRILKDVDISIHPREFVALVGASGAGKTTLMMALNGFARAEGRVLVNGDDLYQHFDLYRTQIGYVPQENIIHNDLTVADALRYAARLRLPPDTSTEEIERRIDSVLQQVGMIGQKDQVVSSLSGGQRKRVSIAVELLADPRLLFLDEPTSGLDPGLEKKMMHTLRQLADGGRTVVLVTHATANITQCDHVCFLSQGRMVYFGPPAEALHFFGVNSGDFADIYAHLDDPDPTQMRQKAAQWEQRFRQSPQYRQYVADRQRTLKQVRQKSPTTAPRKRPRISSLRQFLVLTRRYFNLVLRDALLRTVLLLVMPIIGLFLLLIAEPNWLVGDPPGAIERQLAEALAAGKSSATYTVAGKSQILLFVMALSAVLLGLFASAYEIVKEWPIYQRERMVVVRIIPYIASKVTVLGLFALIQCLLLILVLRLKVHFPAQGVLLPAMAEMYITLILAALAAILMGLLISAVVPNSNTVIYIVFILLFFQIIFSGVMFDLPGFTKGLSNLTLTRWATEALGTSADVEGLNQLTRTRFRPNPMDKEIAVELEKPADDWEPVTVVTKTQEMTVPCPGGIQVSVPITVPEVTRNEMVTVTESVTRTIHIEPDPEDIFVPQEFRIQFTHTPEHLYKDWLILLTFALAFGTGTVIVLKRKDVG